MVNTHGWVRWEGDGDFILEKVKFLFEFWGCRIMCMSDHDAVTMILGGFIEKLGPNNEYWSRVGSWSKVGRH